MSPTSIIKALLTEAKVTIERKYQDPHQVSNPILRAMQETGLDFGDTYNRGERAHVGMMMLTLKLHIPTLRFNSQESLDRLARVVYQLSLAVVMARTANLLPDRPTHPTRPPNGL